MQKWVEEYGIVLLCPPMEVVGFEQTTPLFAGEGSEGIGNLIENYIKEIEELRYFFKKTKTKKKIKF